MPFCPVCKCEYREGFKMCSDCKVELVDVLSKESNLKIVPKSNTDNSSEEVSLDDVFDEKVIENLDLSSEEVQELIDNPPSEEDVAALKNFIIKQRRIADESNEYISSKDKASEHKSTGIMLIVIGILGIVVLLLCLFGVIPYNFSVFSYVIFGLLVLFFLMFVYFGISSIFKSKELEIKSEEESKITTEFEKWFDVNITKELIDDGLSIDEDSENAYFVRHAKVTSIIAKNYPDLDEGYIDKLFDDKYDEIFE